MTSIPTRRYSEIYQYGPVTLRIGFNPETGLICESFMELPFKHGSELANAIHDANIALSKRLQGKEVT